MTHAHQISTTEMQVTSIRLEQDLKEHLKALAGHQGYQSLIREILWDYVNQRSAPSSETPHVRAMLKATAKTEERCTLTGQLIAAGDSMLLGLTVDGTLVPLSAQCGSTLAESRVAVGC